MIALSLTARIVLPGNGENIYIVVQLVLAIECSTRTLFLFFFLPLLGYVSLQLCFPGFYNFVRFSFIFLICAGKC